MFKVIDGNTQGFFDAEEFIEFMNSPPRRLNDFFDRDSDIYVARAPGRLDVMGGIADYSGSHALEMPIAEATFAAVQKSEQSTIRIASLQPGSNEDLEYEMTLGDLPNIDSSCYYEEAREFFRDRSSSHWAGYVAGVFFVLRRERAIEFDRGASILISSRVPVGKGVSSSAALEVAVMHAVSRAYEIDLDAREIALLCQKVENNIVGAACGVMDQIASSCSTANSLISLLCQPAEIQGTITIPHGIEFWGIDSGVRHAVSDSDYTKVRVGAFMGYRMIAEMAGLQACPAGKGFVRISDDRWDGYLANLSPSVYEEQFASGLPEEIAGDDFIQRYHGITDFVTSIDPTRVYPVRGPTEFPIFENDRVVRFARVLQADDVLEHLDLLGELMFDSHNGYARCGLTEPGTDRLVELVRENTENGLCGARITGGGSGGTVAIVGQRGCRSLVDKIAEEYQNETDRTPYVFANSSPGCAPFGPIRLTRSDPSVALSNRNLP